jgi:hypothetical protein
VIGEKYGMLTVMEESPSNDKNMKMYLCRCDCGKETVKSTRYLHREELKIRSCGCMAHSSNVKHGFSKNKERLYRIWQAMRWRVSENNTSEKSYRKKNIKCCTEWEDYATFRNWALENGYSDGLSLDRIDNSGNYSPNNCRWADSYVQSNNRGNNTLVTVNGETKTIAEWAKEKHINYSTLRSRVNRQHLSGEKLFASCKSRRDENTGRFIGGYDL